MQQKQNLKNHGFSTIEALLAGGLLALLAIFVLPSLLSLQDKSKSTGFRAVCTGFVRAKLNEYLTGASSGGGGSGKKATGWDYTVQRIQTVSGACTASPTPAAPGGFREQVNGNGVLTASAPTETSLPSNLLGFQLWVNLQHYNPRTLTSGQPTRSCPAANYQFQRLGDAIEVTVTAMIRTRPLATQGGRSTAGKHVLFGDLGDVDANTPHPSLTCAASQTVFPPRLPFRYYLTSDGKIRNYQNTVNSLGGLASAESMESHFRTVWSRTPDGGTLSSEVAAGIMGFAISPDNRVVYILKSGTLFRYVGCADTSITLGGQTFNGVPDCASATVEAFSAPADNIVNIESITVNFNNISSDSDDEIYGLYSTGFSGTSTDRRVFKISSSNLVTNRFAETTDYTLLRLPRVRGIFLTYPIPQTTAPTLFIVDNSCYTGTSTSATAKSTYCVTIYNTQDTSGLGSQVGDLPLQVEAVSY